MFCDTAAAPARGGRRPAGAGAMARRRRLVRPGGPAAAPRAAGSGFADSDLPTRIGGSDRPTRVGMSKSAWLAASRHEGWPPSRKRRAPPIAPASLAIRFGAAVLRPIRATGRQGRGGDVRL